MSERDLPLPHTRLDLNPADEPAARVAARRTTRCPLDDAPLAHVVAGLPTSPRTVIYLHRDGTWHADRSARGVDLEDRPVAPPPPFVAPPAGKVTVTSGGEVVDAAYRVPTYRPCWCGTPTPPRSHHFTRGPVCQDPRVTYPHPYPAPVHDDRDDRP